MKANIHCITPHSGQKIDKIFEILSIFPPKQVVLSTT